MIRPSFPIDTNLKGKHEKMSFNSLYKKVNSTDATKEDIAKFIGMLLGYKGKKGGWIYKNNGNGSAIAHGWMSLAFYFEKIGIIKTNQYRSFIDWKKIPQEWFIY